MVRLTNPIRKSEPLRKVVVADVLNPRRLNNCYKLMAYLNWHGGKMFLEDHTGELRRDQQLEPYAAAQAVDDLYTLGAVDIRVNGNRTTVLSLTQDLDKVVHRGMR